MKAVHGTGGVDEYSRDKGGAYRDAEYRDDAIVVNVHREVMDFPTDAAKPYRILQCISGIVEIVRGDKILAGD